MSEFQHYFPSLPRFTGRLEDASSFLTAFLLDVEDWMESPVPPSDARLVTSFLKSLGSYHWGLQFTTIDKHLRPSFKSLVQIFREAHFLHFSKEVSLQYLATFNITPGMEFFAFVQEFSSHYALAGIADPLLCNI